MRVSYKWLQEFVEIDISPRELADRLTQAGITVEGVAEPAAGIEKVVTGRIESIQPHPNADKLVVTRVNTLTEDLQIITAATNVKEGDVIPVAVEGARLAGGLVIKRAKLRGVESRGMMCSGQELGIDPRYMPSDEAHGIMILPPETPLGKDAGEILGLNDFILELDLTPNRGDCLSMLGVARETAALLGRQCRIPQPVFPEMAETIADLARVEIEASDLCGRFAGRLIKNVRVGRSPLWMQQRLRQAGIRPISNIVDVTNYVMLELGQPLHAFDYADIRPRPGETQPAIIVRRATEGEQMATLDGELRTFDNEMLLITDGGGPVGIGGVMGGLDSEVKDHTQDILLEAANFNFINIRRTCQVLKLSTEAGSRFGKRVDAELALVAAARAAELMADLAGARVDVVAGDLYPGKPEPRVIHYSPALADRILGLAIPPEDQLRILASLEFHVEVTESLPIPGNPDQGDVWRVTVPSYRLDVSLPVDLVEEIGRIWGYDHFPVTLIEEELPPLRRNVSLEEEDHVRDILVGLGLDEVITYSLIDPEDEARLHPDPAATLELPGERVLLKNYLAPERSQMRRSMLPGALRTAWSNLRFLERIAIFEVGHVYFLMREPDPDTPDTGVDEPRRLCVLLTGPRQGRWYAPTDREAMDYFDLKGIAEALLRSLALEDKAQWATGQHPAYHPGRCAAVTVNEQPLGVVGELHPLVREAFDLPEQPVALLEWDLDALLDAARQADAEKKIGTISNYPPVYEDLALVVDESLPAAEVQRAILDAGRPLVTQALLFDVYRGEQVGAGRKSLAFALTYQSPGKPLDERDVAKLRERVIKLVQKQLNATLRGA